MAIIPYGLQSLAAKRRGFFIWTRWELAHKSGRIKKPRARRDRKGFGYIKCERDNGYNPVRATKPSAKLGAFFIRRRCELARKSRRIKKDPQTRSGCKGLWVHQMRKGSWR